MNMLMMVEGKVFLFLFLINFCSVLSGKQDTFRCIKDSKEVATGLKNKELWAIKMIDASAKIPTGMFEGDLVDCGNFYECLSVKDNEKDIRGQHCMLKLVSKEMLDFVSDGLISKLNFLTIRYDYHPVGFRELALYLGICIPDSCPANDIGVYIKNVLNRGGGQVKSLYPLAFGDSLKNITEFIAHSNFTVLENSCTSARNESKLSAADWITIGILSSIVFLVLLNTLIDFFKRQDIAMFEGFPQNFSLYRNMKILFTVKDNKHDIQCLNGMKVISIIWIIIMHRFFITCLKPTTKDLKTCLIWMKSSTSMFLLNGDKAVDTFFVISGLLVSYTLLRYMDKNIKMNLPSLYLLRYIRLAPALAVVVLFSATLTDNLIFGQYLKTYGVLKSQSNCIHSWWKTLLFLQTYYPANMCVGTSWYLSIDIQLYFISIIILMALKRWKKLILSLCLSLIILSVVISFSVTWIYELNGIFIMGGGETTYLYYFAIYCRYGPYLMGFLLGYYLYTMEVRQQEPDRINKITLIIGWLISGIVTYMVLIHVAKSLTNDPYNKIEHSIYNGIHRHAWAMVICWIIFICRRGHGGIINEFLSLPIFQIFGKLTYSAFLIHFYYQQIIMARKIDVRFDKLEIFTDGFGDVTVVFFLSAILALFVEYPLMPNKENVLKVLKVNLNASSSIEVNENIEMNNLK